MFGPRAQSPRIMVRPGVTDMRKAINGLSILVEEELELDPFEDGTLFRFCNRTGRSTRCSCSSMHPADAGSVGDAAVRYRLLARSCTSKVSISCLIVPQ